jgi:hypothetical protein
MKRRVSQRSTSAEHSAGTRSNEEHDRLVASPVFVYSCQRSGSTLLRMILDSHSQICAPHEMHLRELRASFNNWYSETAWKKLGVTQDDLANLLWDRLLHLQLGRSGKAVIVDKTPGNTLLWERIAHSWPQARYIFLKRHPLRMVESLTNSQPEKDVNEQYNLVNRHVTAWVKARAALSGLTVSYEELTADPERVVQGVCAELHVPWEPAMLDYGKHPHTGDFRRGLGDWREKIKTGAILPPEPPPDPSEIPEQLREACRNLGYI